MKKKIIWNESYSVGVLDLDAHHIGLIDSLNVLNDPKIYKSGHEDLILKTLKELTVYTQYHFSNEEAYMRRYKYPDLEEHLTEHEYFINEIANFKVAFDLGEKEIYQKLAYFLKNWFIKHILTVDKKYADYFKEKGIKV